MNPIDNSHPSLAAEIVILSEKDHDCLVWREFIDYIRDHFREWLHRSIAFPRFAGWDRDKPYSCEAFNQIAMDATQILHGIAQARNRPNFQQWSIAVRDIKPIDVTRSITLVAIDPKGFRYEITQLASVHYPDGT